MRKPQIVSNFITSRSFSGYICSLTNEQLFVCRDTYLYKVTTVYTVTSRNFITHIYLFESSLYPNDIILDFVCYKKNINNPDLMTLYFRDIFKYDKSLLIYDLFSFDNYFSLFYNISKKDVLIKKF